MTNSTPQRHPGRLMTEQEAAEFLGVSRRLLQKQRRARIGIPFIRVGGWAIRYAETDLLDYIASNRTKAGP